jgi:hypothetical protein
MNKESLDKALAKLLASGALGAIPGAAGGAIGAGEDNRLLGAGAGALGGMAGGMAGGSLGMAGGMAGGSLGVLGQNLLSSAGLMPPGHPLSQMPDVRGGVLGSVLGGGAGGFAAGKGVKALKEGSMSPINYAFDIGKQRALKEAGYDTVEEVIKEAQALGLYEEPSKTAAAVDTNALAELRARLK